MRRISLALALTGAVAAGCSGGANSSSDGSGKGVPGGTFTVVVQNGQAINGAPANPGLAIQGGYVTSTPAGIDCGIAGHALCSATFPANTVVSLTATAVGTDPANSLAYLFLGWAGDCQGEGACSLTGASDKYIVVMFAGERTGHPNWADPALHAQQYLNFVAVPQPAGTLDCTSCHGSSLQGQGLAPSCGVCHSWPLGGHFTMTGHNSGACARCHSGDGLKDYLGVTGSGDKHLLGYTAATGYAKAPALTTGATFGNGMTCDTCHNSATVLGGGTLNSIRFPSATYNTDGVTVTVDTKTAICGQCHTTVRDDRNVQTVALQLQGVTDVDAQLVTANNKPVRPHYLGAASTILGSETPVYLQFAGNIYTPRNQHGGLSSCTSCHNAHTGELPKDPEILSRCGSCHNDELTGLPVRTFTQLEESRQYGFDADIDQDGTIESLKLEIEGLKSKLVAALKAYGTNVGGADMCFVLDSNGLADQPYVLVDSGVACGTAPNNVAYNKFTARSLKAAFNYMAIQNDPGAWAHNPRFVVEILFDSINDLNDGLTGKTFTAVPNGLRAFNGHFGGAEDTSQYAAIVYHATFGTSDTVGAMGFTSAACYQCHGGKVGIETYLGGMPAAIPAIPAGGKVTAFQCDTCHTYNGTDMKGIRTVSTVYFPPQKNNTGGQVSFDAVNLPKSFAVCGTCHSARENKASVDAKVLSPGLFNTGLVNMHYLGAAATVMGTRTKSWYEYDGKAYTAYPAFWKAGTAGNAPGPHGSPHGAECTGCHQAKASKHEFGVDFNYCAGCHAGNYALAPKEEEYASMKAELLAAIDAYVNLPANVTAFQAGNGADATGICYDGSVYGYVLVKKATGCSATAAKLDLNSMRAGYNLHWMNKDPGGWAHNEYYVMQLVYDSIVDLGGTPSFTVTASSTDATLNRP